MKANILPLCRHRNTSPSLPLFESAEQTRVRALLLPAKYPSAPRIIATHFGVEGDR